MDIYSLNVLKDGRIALSANGNFYIYNSDFSEKKKFLPLIISWNTAF